MVMLPLDNYRDTPPLDTALKDFAFRIAPLFHQVLTTRVQLALNKLSKDSKTLDYELPNRMRAQYGASALSQYLTCILSSVFEHDKYVRRMLVGLTGRNIRMALEIFVEFCTSGLKGELANALIHVQVDIGFGDHVYPPPKYDTFPSLLPDLPAANILVYPSPPKPWSPRSSRR